MNISRFTSTVLFAVVAAACSDDEPSDTPNPGSETNANQPSASSGGSGGSAGGSSAAGTAGAPASSGGGSSEAQSDDLPIDSEGKEDEGTSQPPPSAPDASTGAADTSMSFFVTSRGTGNGGNFGGLEGADAFCTELATAVSAALGAKTWRAYLSTSTVNARDRIGAGPWRNAAGVVIAENVEQLHDQTPGMVMGPTGAASEENYPHEDSTIALDETGAQVPNNPVLHDIITGTNLDGTVSASGTCSDWTSTEGTTRNGHSNRTGGGENRASWNSAHDTACGIPNPPGSNFQPGTVSQGGGQGSIYCFAID